MDALLIGIAASLTMTPGSAVAHDIPDERVDRGLQILLEPPRVRVAYEISLSEWTLYQDLKRLASDEASGELNDWVAHYAELVAPLNLRGLLATIDEKEIDWEFERVEVGFDRHPLLTFYGYAEVPLSGRLAIRDTNYLSSYGTSRIALGVAEGTQAVGYSGPERLDEVPERPPWDLTDEEELGTRRIEVVYGPALGTATDGPEGGPSETTRASGPAPRWKGDERLTGLFWSSSGRTSTFLLVVAFVIGAAHAIQPGHGKTAVVGTSLQGARPIGRGLLLAGTAAMAHLSLAVILAIVAVVITPEGFGSIDSVATRGVGLMFGLIGAWRVGKTLHRQSDEDLASGRRIDTPRDAIAAGLAIGLIPCWDAVMLLAFSWLAGKVVLGVALLIAFTLGASTTLLGVALAAGLFRSVASRLYGATILERILGMAGGALMVGIGAFLFLA